MKKKAFKLLIKSVKQMKTNKIKFIRKIKTNG